MKPVGKTPKLKTQNVQELSLDSDSDMRDNLSSDSAGIITDSDDSSAEE